MRLDHVITLANASVRLRFLAMERSLRATGCDAPLRVIPYDDELFELPRNSSWWKIPELITWTLQRKMHPTMRKYQCLTISNFQFVDSDVCFVRNPTDVLAPHEGFITSCGHWHNPAETLTDQARARYCSHSTTWQKNTFNTGQWACDCPLFSIAELKARAESVDFADTCVTFPYHEQPGLNLLVHSTGVPIQNLTLPPWNMQSTWAGDYPGEYQSYWRTKAETPYLIHWAGTPMEIPRPVNELFYNFLTAAEKAEWDNQLRTSIKRTIRSRRSIRATAIRWRNGIRAFARAIQRG